MTAKIELEQRRELMKIHQEQKAIENRMCTENLSDLLFKKLNNSWDSLEEKKQKIKGVNIFE